jgi:DNA-binding GntR family transcriptional regulator
VARAHSRYTTVEAAAALRDAILTGVFQPGQRLRQQRLAEDLMMSRIPVVSALRTLEREGLVTLIPHRGATVRILEPTEIEETYQIRILLEIFALRKALGRITPQETEELADLAREVDGSEDGDRAAGLTEQFYQRIYTIADCPLTADIVSRRRANVGRYWLGLRVGSRHHPAHSVIVEAIRSGDSARAEHWITDHLTRVSTELQQRSPKNSRRSNRLATVRR